MTSEFIDIYGKATNWYVDTDKMYHQIADIVIHFNDVISGKYYPLVGVSYFYKNEHKDVVWRYHYSSEEEKNMILLEHDF